MYVLFFLKMDQYTSSMSSSFNVQKSYLIVFSKFLTLLTIRGVRRLLGNKITLH